MPSGPKKRKAAKRKKEMLTHHQLDSSTNSISTTTPQTREGNGTSHEDDLYDHEGKDHNSGSDHHLSDEDEEVEKDKEKSPGNMEDAENNGGRDKKLETAPISSSEMPVLKGEEDVRIEHVQGERGEGGSGALESETPVSEEVLVIPVTQLNPINEEMAEVIESLAAASETQASVDSPPVDDEVRAVVPPAEAVAIVQPREMESREGILTTEVANVPLVVHRASWWNCCGLLDVLSGSER